MLVFFFTLTLFFFWGFLGSSLLIFIRPDLSRLGAALASPSLGVAFILLWVFSLSRLGFAVMDFAHILLLLSLLFAILAYCRVLRDLQSPPTLIQNLRWSFPFLLIFVLALGLSSWPFFYYGADWLSYGNNDMTNYSLLAQRFMEHGFFDVPEASELLSGKNYEQTFWLQGLVERPGAELLLAWVASLVHRAPTKCFMPLIVSLHLVVISGAAALVAETSRRRLSTLLACVFLSFAPLLTFGALYQLLGQTAGMAILVGSLTILVPIDWTRGSRHLLGLSFLFTLLLAAQLLLYPEMLPFLVLSALTLFLGRAVLQKQSPTLSTATLFLLPPVLLLPLLLRSYLFGAFTFLARQAHSGVTGYKQAADVFHQYLLLNGLGGLWGFFNIYAHVSDPYLSIAITMATFLSFYLLLCSLRLAFRCDLLGIVLMVMISAAVFLRYQGSAFGLYKMAMYLQPFLWCSLAVALTAFRNTRLVLFAVCPLFLFFLGRTQFDYVASSRGEADRLNGTFCEIYRGSSTKVLSELEALSQELRGQSLVSDSSNLVLAKLQAAALRGTKLSFPFFDLYPSKSQVLRIAQAPELEADQIRLHNAENGRVQKIHFDMKTGSNEQNGAMRENKFWLEDFTQPEDGVTGPFSLLINTSLQTPFNRRFHRDDRRNFHHLPWADVKNHLIFIDSQFGRLYYSHDRPRIALYQLEPDYFYPQQTMAGVGRHFVFQVIHPTPSVRLQLWLTASLKHDGKNLLPRAQAIGTERVNFQFVGRGSGRIFSPPLQTQTIAQRQYLGIDMGEDGERWKQTTDPRKLTGFLRDLSLISEEEFDSRKSPSMLSRFPQDLEHPNLQYSGIYEDGWLSEESSITLDAPNEGEAAVLEVKGLIPGFREGSFEPTATVKIDGEQRFQKKLKAGNFQLDIPLGVGKKRYEVEMLFSETHPLPGDDMRPVSAQIHRIAIISEKN